LGGVFSLFTSSIVKDVPSIVSPPKDQKRLNAWWYTADKYNDIHKKLLRKATDGVENRINWPIWMGRKGRQKMKDNIDYNKLFEVPEELYYNLFDTERIPIAITLTDDLNKTHAEFRPDLKENIERERPENDSNGRIVLPRKLDDPVRILMNVKKIIEYSNDGSMTWVGTFAHELTHALDYKQMAKAEGLESYEPLEKVEKYFMFQLWSEYHARKRGYKFLRKYFEIAGELPDREEQIKHIKTNEWPYHYKWHYKEYHLDNNGNRQLYITMQLLGRYSVWCDLFPEHFNVNELNNDFVASPWMGHLFNFLREHEEFEKIYPCFEEFNEVISENWGWRE